MTNRRFEDWVGQKVSVAITTPSTERVYQGWLVLFIPADTIPNGSGGDSDNVPDDLERRIQNLSPFKSDRILLRQRKGEFLEFCLPSGTDYSGARIVVELVQSKTAVRAVVRPKAGAVKVKEICSLLELLYSESHPTTFSCHESIARICRHAKNLKTDYVMRQILPRLDKLIEKNKGCNACHGKLSALGELICEQNGQWWEKALYTRQLNQKSCVLSNEFQSFGSHKGDPAKHVGLGTGHYGVQLLFGS